MIPRRDFFRLSAGSAAGTALGGLTALGADLTPKIALAQEAPIAQAREYPSVCPDCAVGCGIRVHVAVDRLVNIEGNPATPVNYGNLCPKAAASDQPHVNPNRL